MILYHTTHVDVDFSNAQTLQATYGATIPFATEPLCGIGPFVFVIDVPMTTAEPYMYTDTYRLEKAQHFALPVDLVRGGAAPRRELYQDITGHAWNTFVVDVRDTRPKKGQVDLIGTWGLVWISRRGVVDVRVHTKTDDHLALEITTTSDFNPESDYVVFEKHTEMYAADNGPPREKWELTVLAGQPPRWQRFPEEWQEWVRNPVVVNSAVDYLLRHFPSVRPELSRALVEESKTTRMKMLRNAIDRMGELLSRRYNQHVDLGKFSGHSITAVLAVPMRVANRVGKWVGEEWESPVPQPEFQHPNDSGRVLLANLHGAWPTWGPGIDQSPLDRPFEERRSALLPPKRR